jgi:hypothetical protein
LFYGHFYGADLGQEKGNLRPKSTFYGGISFLKSKRWLGPTRKITDLNKEVMELAAKIQENFEELGI